MNRPLYILRSIVKAVKHNPMLIFVVLFICLWLVIPLFSKGSPESSTNLMHEWIQEIDGSTLTTLMSFDQPVLADLQSDHDQTLSFSNIIIPLITNSPYQDLRLLFGHELPNFPGNQGRIAIAGSGTNQFTTSVESAPPDYIFEQEEEIDESEQRSTDVYEDETVYIYNTHNREAFLPYLDEDATSNEAFNHVDNVVDLSVSLKERLQERGIDSYVEKTDFYKILQQKGLEYHESYDVAREVVADYHEEEPTEYFIDIHRDAQPHRITTTTINDKPAAKLMFVVGGEHEDYKANLEFAAELHEMLEKRYPSLSRGVQISEGEGTNGVFNQDLSEQKLLLEVGGVDNDFEEMNYSLDLFADVLADYIAEDNQSEGE
ncbi:stage II sporulation protein P [Alkalibacillus almallahensis]|uniref:stage II sporulation protein P n=1 Tax=Alkalibacillus almallahensis TaxID=1379154 RepID=UPI00141DDE88|nr:stage II sporulation protein P [Alkalibacillus almallahensis]NIK11319.1 stage II sporulation protein P [Alkalibacillus almallahensis]